MTCEKKAETMYQQAKQSDPTSLMIGMLAVLGSPEVDETVRRHDAILLRQLVNKGPEKDFCFPRLSAAHKMEFASELLRLFEVETLPRIQTKIGDVVSKLAEYVCDTEDPRGSLGPPNGWPALLPLVFRMADPASNQNRESCVAAISLLKACVGTLQDGVVGARTELQTILSNALQNSDLKLRTAALLLVCEIVGVVQKKDWVSLLQTAPVLWQVLEQMAAANDTDTLQEAMQALIEVATLEPDFFKASLQQNMQPAQFFAAVAKNRQMESLRPMALEWLVSFLEKRSKWLTKTLPAFAALCVEVCMELMLEVEDGEQELKVWAERMDDEEGDEDEDELFHAGEEAIDRVAQAVTMESLGTVLFQVIGTYVKQEQWQAKHAALAAVKQTVEYVEEKEHVNQMAQLLIQHVDSNHPRVRYKALHAIGQLANDQSPHFQEAWHEKLMPVLLMKMDDPVDRVAAMAMSAFVSFGEELDKALMASYAQGFMMKLVNKLQTSQHRGVREESITSIAVIAGVIEKDFSQYYGEIMPMLKHFVMKATAQNENRLRGKSFECMSLLGIAVGKEKFLPDAKDAISEMMKTQLEADDVQREYIKEASERIAQCLKRDFEPFLQHLLPGLFRSLKIEEEAVNGPVDEDDDEYVQVTNGEGKTVQVKSSKFEELSQAVQLLLCFCTELEGAYFDYAQTTAEHLLPLLTPGDDEMSMLIEDVRGTALQVWALLIKVAKVGAQERGIQSALPQQLFTTGLQKTFETMEKSSEAEKLSETASGITECIKNVGPGVLSASEVHQLVGKIFALTDQSLQRSQELEKVKQEQKSGDAAAVQALGGEDEDDEEDDQEQEEEQCRRNYEEVLGALMQVAPAEFMPCLEQCGQKITMWLQRKDLKVLALYLACDLILHLKEESVKVWPIFMPQVFASLSDADADLRTAGAYAVNLAAPLNSFAEAAPQAFQELARIVGAPKPKKRDDKGKIAFDNAVAALLSLAKSKPSHCPAGLEVWPLILSKLPLRDDEEEAQKVHESLADLVLAQEPSLVGGDGKNLGPTLSILAEVHHMEGICNKTTEEKILQIFKMIPQNILGGLAAGFTGKQQKKIESMLAG
mmetsp:Transcript_72305/g.157002  ORF Transcript_72305/g.157002 Transcript_72305/m.157002 type:complete len:1097 (-) Transcript_72305:209-3499(-)